ncbi:MAG: bifunctional riboflavin kinase/FAD synthetase [Flavihumibacter sp.]|nr:bifunctional riboflavin kinase/FAD synthetase [Flavihumibacter sp.]
MKVFYHIDQLPAFNKAVITIGTFDGVHLGHLQIIDRLKKEAARIGGETVVITFQPHPRKIVSTKPLQLINSPAEKIALLDAAGIDNLVVVPFTPAFAEQSATDYIQHFLIDHFHPHTIIIGYDHQFGNNRAGNYHLLEQFAARHKFLLIEIPAHEIENSTISSTKIREALLVGNCEEAANFLGYAYFFEGRVVEGNKLGRTIGYPTANLLVDDEDKLIPGNGVYAVKAQLQTSGAISDTLNGMMNIGLRPTVDGTKRVIEVNLFSFDRDIYGDILRVTLQHYLRTEQKFSGLDALKQQLATDKQQALQLLTS